MTDLNPLLPPSGEIVPQKAGNEPEHWMVRKENIRLMWIGSAVVLAALTALDLVIHKHSHFKAEDIFGFGSFYGFIACVVLVFGSKALGAFLKRKDTYYDD